MQTTFWKGWIAGALLFQSLQGLAVDGSAGIWLGATEGQSKTAARLLLDKVKFSKGIYGEIGSGSLGLRLGYQSTEQATVGKSNVNIRYAQSAALVAATWQPVKAQALSGHEDVTWSLKTWIGPTFVDQHYSISDGYFSLNDRSRTFGALAGLQGSLHPIPELALHLGATVHHYNTQFNRFQVRNQEWDLSLLGGMSYEF